MLSHKSEIRMPNVESSEYQLLPSCFCAYCTTTPSILQNSIGFQEGELTNYEGQLLTRQLQYVGQLLWEIDEHIEAICSFVD
jgi:hypothetical protein